MNSWTYEGKTYDLEFIDSNNQHTYKINNIYVVGCTSVTGILPKGKTLQWWASRLACEKMGFLQHKKSGKIINSKEACENSALKMQERIKLLTVKEYQNLLAEAYKAHSISLEKSAEIGKTVHGYCEKFIKEKTLPSSEEKKEVLNSFNKFLKWTEENQVEWIESEMIVGSGQYMFGGKFDAVAKVNGKITLIDFKTSNGIYSDYSYQTAGYRLAYEEMGKTPAIEQNMILWIPKTGNDFKAYIVPTPYESDKQVFLAALELYKCLENNKRIQKEEEDK